MARTIAELKQAAIAAIDARREDILALGDSIFKEPELGFKEFKTAEKFGKVLDSLGMEHRDGVAVTGVVAPLKGKESKVRLSIMGELDAIVSPTHPDADPVTGAAHCCGHNAMIAGLAGVAYALHDAKIMEELSGDIVLMGVPAEEYVEIGYRMKLREEGKIHFLGGKQEFVRVGEMDDIDMMIMQHTTGMDDTDIWANGGGASNGFMGQSIQYTGKEAHAGGMPHAGINALDAAMIGLAAVNAQRSTFKDEDHIRVHPIITKGGDLVNIVPADVRLENYVRGATVEAILDATAKVKRAFEAGGYAMGAQCEVTNIPGYLPFITNDGLLDIMYENLKMLMDENHVRRTSAGGSGSTDAGDISQLMPTLHANIGGAVGNFHTERYRMVDKDMAYLTAAKALTLCAIDLLADGAEKALAIKNGFSPSLTKEKFLKEWGQLK